MSPSAQIMLLQSECDILALDVLAHASEHLSTTFSLSDHFGQVRARYEAKELLQSAANAILAELDGAYMDARAGYVGLRGGR